VMIGERGRVVRRVVAGAGEFNNGPRWGNTVQYEYSRVLRRTCLFRASTEYYSISPCSFV
jgi:hypothetical protein